MRRDGLSLPDIGLALVICAVWAGNLVSAKVGMTHFPPFLFMALRFALVLALLAPFLRRPPAGQWPAIVMISLCIGVVHFVLLFWALARSEDISSIGVLLQTYIPMGVLLAIGLMGERVGRATLAAIGFTFLGVLVVGFDPLVLGQADVLAITLLAALFQALGSIWQRRITGMGVMNFQAWIALIALPPMLLATFLFDQGQLETIATARPAHWGAVAYTAGMASIVGHGLFFFLVQRNPVSAVMPYLQATPLLAVLFGILIWGDAPGPRLLFGGAMIVGGVLAITLLAGRRWSRPTGRPS